MKTYKQYITEANKLASASMKDSNGNTFIVSIFDNGKATLTNQSNVSKSLGSIAPAAGSHAQSKSHVMKIIRGAKDSKELASKLNADSKIIGRWS